MSPLGRTSLFAAAATLCLCVLLSSPVWAAPAGRVLLAAGDTTAIRGAQVIRLVAGSEVQSQDLLRTGKDSNLQVRLTDESVIALKPDSALSLQKYVFEGRTDGTESAVFRLLKGGFRTVTGLIGRINKPAYRVGTAVATIGIRGTAYSLALCEGGGCRHDNGAQAADGLYGNVTNGQVVATNQSGESAFRAGDTFFASSPESQFQRLLSPPAFLADRLEGQRRGPNRREDSANREQEQAQGQGQGQGQGQNQGQGQRADGSAPAAAPRPAGTTAGAPPPAGSTNGDTSAPPPATDPNATAPGTITTQPAPLPTSPLPTAGAPLIGQPLATLTGTLPPLTTENLASTGTPALLPPADGYVFAYPYAAVATGYIQQFADTGGVYDSGNNLMGFLFGSMTGGVTLAQISDRGQIASGTQVLTWGRWNNATIQTPQGVINGLPLLFGTANGVGGGTGQTLPTSGVVNYAVHHGPSPVAYYPGLGGAVSVGNIQSASLSIDFTNAQAKLNMAMAFTEPTATSTVHTVNIVNMIAPQTFGSPPPPNVGDFVSSAQTVACSPSCVGNAQYQVGLTGPSGVGLAVTVGGVSVTTFSNPNGNFSASFLRVFVAP